MKIALSITLNNDDDIDVLRQENGIRSAFVDFLEELGEADIAFSIATEEGLVQTPPRRRAPRAQPNGPAPDMQPEISPDL
jgi:hypothetical protein